MNLPTILVQLTGLALLGWTIRSIMIHVKERKKAKAEGKYSEQSLSEQILNNILLYAWLAFMLAFSIGMVVNNIRPF